MAVEKHIPLRITRMNNSENLDRFQGVTIDNFNFAVVDGGVTKVYYESTSKEDMDYVECQDTLQEIVDKANASGYTQNGLLIVPVTKIDNVSYSPAKDYVLNRQKFEQLVLTANQTKSLIHYSTEIKKRPRVIETTDILLPAVPEYY